MASSPIVTYLTMTYKVYDGVSAGIRTAKDETINVQFTRNVANLLPYKVSLNSPFNQVSGSYRANRGVSRFEVRVTPAEATSYGPGEGALLHLATGIAANTTQTFTFVVTSADFTGSSSSNYRICLLAQSSLDYSWDCTQIFTCLNNAKDTSIIYAPSDAETYEVHDTFVEAYDSSTGRLKRAIANTMATTKQDAVADLSDFQIEWYGEYGLKAIFNPVANTEALDDEYYIVLQLLEHYPCYRSRRGWHQNSGRGRYTSIEIAKEDLAVMPNVDQDGTARFYRPGADAINEELESHERFYGRTVKFLSVDELKQGWAILGTPEAPVAHIDEWTKRQRRKTYWHYNSSIGRYEAYKQYSAEIYFTKKLNGTLKYEADYRYFADNVLVKYWYSDDPSICRIKDGN